MNRQGDIKKAETYLASILLQNCAVRFNPLVWGCNCNYWFRLLKPSKQILQVNTELYFTEVPVYIVQIWHSNRLQLNEVWRTACTSSFGSFLLNKKKKNYFNILIKVLWLSTKCLQYKCVSFFLLLYDVSTKSSSEVMRLIQLNQVWVPCFDKTLWLRCKE